MGIDTTKTDGFAKFDYDGKALDIFYSDSGTPDNFAGKVLVILHGSGPGGSGASFAPLVNALYGYGIRSVCVDCAGFGKSSPVVCQGNRSTMNANSVKAVLDTLGINKASLLGTSMGAHTAGMFGLLYPAMTERLVLVSGGTGGRASLQAGTPSGVTDMLDFYENPSEEKMARFLKSVFANPAIATPELVKLMMASATVNPTHLQNFTQSVQNNFEQFEDIASELHKITAKTLIVWGTEDRLVPLEIGLTLVSRMTNADLHIMSNVGHAPTLERPQAFVKLVLGFLLD